MRDDKPIIPCQRCEAEGGGAGDAPPYRGEREEGCRHDEERFAGVERGGVGNHGRHDRVELHAAHVDDVVRGGDVGNLEGCEGQEGDDAEDGVPPGGCDARTSYDEYDALRGNIGFESRGSLRGTLAPFGPL